MIETKTDKNFNTPPQEQPQEQIEAPANNGPLNDREVTPLDDESSYGCFSISVGAITCLALFVIAPLIGGYLVLGAVKFPGILPKFVSVDDAFIAGTCLLAPLGGLILCGAIFVSYVTLDYCCPSRKFE
jgi:hypothetical protein